jgi:SAM-dependent methyltransferase
MDPYAAIAAYYDLEHADFSDDIDLYLNLVVAGPVLELGSGSGRITQALAGAGHQVWAVDQSQVMLDRARDLLDSHADVHLIHAAADDLQRMERMADFRVAILSLNFLWHLPDWQAQLRALQAVRHQVRHSALVIVDLTNPLSMSDRGSRGDWRERFHWSNGSHHVLGSSASWDDPAEQLMSVTLLYDEWNTNTPVTRVQSELTLRYLYRFELEVLLHTAGFTLELLYGSYDLDPYSAESPNMIALCRAEKE